MLHHLAKIIAFTSIVVLLTLYVGYLLAGPVILRFQKRWGFDTPSDLAAVPLILLAAQLFGFFDLPILSGFSRHVEHEADQFGLELTHSNHAAATAFVKLVQNAVMVPQPGALIQFWCCTHPSIAERIAFCNTYRPWETGQPLKYEKCFAPANPVSE